MGTFHLTKIGMAWGGAIIRVTPINAGGKSAATIRVIPGPLLKSGLGYLPSDQDWNGLGRGHYSSRTQINAGSLKCDHSSSYPMDHY